MMCIKMQSQNENVVLNIIFCRLDLIGQKVSNYLTQMNYIENNIITLTSDTISWSSCGGFESAVVASRTVCCRHLVTIT